MFKIVQTKEPGYRQPLLSVVPTSWENNNVLYWPNEKKVSVLQQLLRNPKSKPKEGWLKQSCIKKRDNFYSYEAAELELDAMTKSGDTDLDTEAEEERLVKKRKEIGREEAANFNNIMEEQMTAVNTLKTNKNKSILETEAEDNTGYVDAERPITENEEQNSEHNENEDFTAQDETLFIADEHNDVQNVLLFHKDIVTTLLENQKKILENQEKILKEIAVHRTILNIICDSSTENKENVSEKSEKKPPKDLPIKNIENLDKLELNLHDEKFRRNMIEAMSAVCGKTGKKNGLNCSYALIDHFFDRDFLTQFSWGGGSRSTETKQCFKAYKYVMKTFYHIVSYAAMDFSEVDCETFFKNIIKNSKRRALIGHNIETKKRTSSAKTRPKQLVYKKKEATVTLGECNINIGNTDHDEENKNNESEDVSDHIDEQISQLLGKFDKNRQVLEEQG